MEFVIVRDRDRRRSAAQQRQMTMALHRNLRDVANPFSDPNFQAVYRLSPDMTLNIINELKSHTVSDTGSFQAIPFEFKFLAALHFYAQGSYQKADGRDASISLSQASVSRAISQVTDALNSPIILSRWIKFPNNINERQQIINKNYRKFHIPGVLGYVDGTHILIKKPASHEELYINRKGQHSLNVQMACDCDLSILNICAKYPGSSHDAFIWRSSALKDKMVEIEQISPCWLLGDSGYPLQPWLLTPILNAEPYSPEARYTEMHIKARNCIERCFGVLKSRFRCLHKHRVLEYAPTKAGYITNACAVLHNMCVEFRMPEPDIEISDLATENLYDSNEIITHENDIRNRGMQVRRNVINRLT